MRTKAFILEKKKKIKNKLRKKQGPTKHKNRMPVCFHIALKRLKSSAIMDKIFETNSSFHVK